MVLIIGILSAIALPQYTNAVEKSRAAEALSNIGSFERALNIWKLANPGKNKTFTGSGSGVGELDIAIPDGWVQGTSAMIAADNPEITSCSKNFCYNIVADDRVKAYRANSSTYKYGIIYNCFDDSYACLAYTEADLKLCKSLSNMTVEDSL